MIDEVICESINKMKLLEIHYKYEPKRIIEPHAYGLNKHYEKILNAYQISGFTNTGKIPNWRTFKIQYITKIMESNEYFEVRSDYNPRGYDYLKKMICQIK